MERLKVILSKILNIPESEITDQTSPDNTENWDSFNGLLIVSELENTFNVNFTMDEIREVKCVKDIKASLKSHGVNIK